MTLIIALFLLVFGIWLLWIFISALLSPITGSFNLGDALLRRRLNTAQARLRAAEQALIKGDASAAMSHLEHAFVLSLNTQTIKHSERIAEHNFQILDDLADIFDDSSERLEELTLLEGLFQSRVELVDNLAEQYGLLQKISLKNRKGTAWARKEFEQKISDLKERCGINEKTIRTKVRELFSRRSSGRSEAQFH